jgi:hypothetical protein
MSPPLADAPRPVALDSFPLEASRACRAKIRWSPDVDLGCAFRPDASREACAIALLSASLRVKPRAMLTVVPSPAAKRK